VHERSSGAYRPGDIESLIYTSLEQTFESEDRKVEAVLTIIDLAKLKFMTQLESEVALLSTAVIDTTSPGDFLKSYSELMVTSAPIVWHLLTTICRAQGRISDLKLQRALKAWGHLMKIKNQRHHGLGLAIGLAMYASGCSKQFFEIANDQGLCCSLETVNNHLKSTPCQLASVINDDSKILIFVHDNANFNSAVKFEGPSLVAKMINITIPFAVVTKDFDRDLLGRPCLTTIMDVMLPNSAVRNALAVSNVNNVRCCNVLLMLKELWKSRFITMDRPS
jgi:hypothetical protein